MSFLIDPLLLFILGAALFFAGDKLKLERLAKITIGVLVVLCFISFSLMLYMDIIGCIFPVVCTCIDANCSNAGSQFMLHTSLTNIEKSSFPFPLVIILFILYPVWIYLGYASALYATKKRKIKVLKDFKTYKDVNSRKRFSSDTRYSIIRYPDIENNITDLKDAVDKALNEFGDIWPAFNEINPKPFKVLIKANICGGVPDNPATYTSMDLVEYVVHRVRERGGEPTICDADMIWTKFWENARAIGWVDRIKDINHGPEASAFRSSAQDANNDDYVSLLNLSETDQVYFYFGEGTAFENNEVRNEERVSMALLDADLIISIPKMKTHLLTGVTLGMKNMYGTLPEIDKAKYHETGINEVIYWINYAFPPTLTIIDGGIGGEAIGPLSANSVQYNTIIASRNVVIADAIASKLIGYDAPFDQITHLKLVKDSQSNQRDIRLLDDIPEILSHPAKELISRSNLPPNTKDGEWERPESEMADKYENFIEILLMLPLMNTLFNIGADFFLFDAARLPILKYINMAILQILYEAPLHWIERGKRTLKDIRRGQMNLVIFLLLAAISLFFFHSKGYWSLFFSANKELQLAQSNSDQAFWFIIIFISAIILGALIARRMWTKSLLTIILASLLVAFLVETFGPYAKWWTYNLEPLNRYPVPFDLSILGIKIATINSPMFPIFVIPISIIVIIGLAHYLSGAFAYVGLKGERLRLALVPYILAILALATFLYLEIPINPAAKETEIPIIIIYVTFAILGIYFNFKQPLEWNLALTILAVSFGFFMELPGYLCGFWSYPSNKLPIFLLFHWALNIYAVGGLALLLGINIREAFPESVKDSDPRYWCHEGDELIVKGRHQKALEAYEKAIEIDPQLADAWYGKGNAFACMGRPRIALEAYDKALNIDGRHLEALKRKAGICLDLGLTEKAIKAYNDAISINREDPDLRVDKALAYQHHLVGDFNESLKTYDQALEENKNQVQSRRKLLDSKGFAYADLADLEGSGRWYEEAIKCFDESINVSPTDSFDESLANAWWGKGYALASLRRNEEAVDALRKLEFCPKTTGLAWCDIGDAFYDSGNYKQALQAYNRVINLYPETLKLQLAKAWMGRGDAHTKMDEKFEATKAFMKSIELFEKALDANHNDIEAWLGKGYILYRGKYYQEALEAYTKAIKLAELSIPITTPESSVRLSLAKALTRKGIVLCRMGKLEEAKEDIDAALFAAPNYLPAIKAKKLIIGQTKPEDIDDMIRIDIDTNPRYAEACQRRGYSLRKSRELHHLERS